MYYIDALILCVSVCLSVCLCVSPKTWELGMVAPHFFYQHGELRLMSIGNCFTNLIGSMVPKRKQLESLAMFTIRPHLSHYNGEMLKNLVLFLVEVVSGSGHITSLQRKV